MQACDVLLCSSRIGCLERRGVWREFWGLLLQREQSARMASRRWARVHRRTSARFSENTVGRTHSMKDEAGQRCKPSDIFDFPDNSAVSSVGMIENEKDEESYENFDPPLHSTAIYTDEVELSKHCRSLILSTPQGKEAKRSSNPSEIQESENESIKISAKKRRRKLKPISDESEGTEETNIIIKSKRAEKINTQQHEVVPATAFSELPEKPAALGTPKKIGPLSAKSSVEKETLATKTQKKTTFTGKRKKSRREDIDSDTSDCVHIWCLKDKKSSDIMELDVVLSSFENALSEYKQNIESKICKKAINKFHSIMKEELIKMLKEVQMLKTLKRKNAKMISDIEKKRQRLIEVQNELLRLEPQLKQLQIKHDELKERKSSFRNAAYFLCNLKQLHQDYSDICEREPNVKETYDSSSLPALLIKGRTLLGAERHLQNINHQLEKLLDQK